MREDPWKFRAADAADAARISRLYLDAYSTGGPKGPTRYPFPQFFDDEWVKQAVSQETIRWVVAECQGEVIATAGAVRNIGGPEDLISEGFGLVVDPRFRLRGIAGQLFHFLSERLREEARFVIGEARTAHPGGWHVLRACGFIPLGFEPFAHVTPSGVEAMLLTGLITEATCRERVVNILGTEQVRRLANVILPVLSGQVGGSSSSSNQPLGVSIPAATVATNPRHGHNAKAGTLPDSPKIIRDDVLGQRLLDAWPSQDRHASGVVGLQRLEGQNHYGERFERRYYIARTDHELLAVVRLTWDGLDRRARILDLRSRRDGLQGELLAETCRQVCAAYGTEPLTVVVDLRSDAFDLQVVLEQLGFCATSYYPGLIAVGAGRGDAVQYTKFAGYCRKDGWQKVDRLDWQPALAVATTVLGPPPGQVEEG